MSLYRCAACGSPNVVTDTQNEGYNYVKGAIGTIALGAGGAVAGLNGKTKTVYKCPDCGLTLNEPMAPEIQMLIDMGVMSAEARNNLTLRGVKIDWSTLTSKYKNIENSVVDTLTDSSENNTSVTSTPDSLSPSEENANISLDEKERMRRVYKVEYANYIKQNMEWVKKCKEVIKNRSNLIDDSIEIERAKLKDKITKARDKIVSENTAITDSYTKELENAEKKLASLGFFKFSEKRDTKNLIERLYERNHAAKNAINDAEDNYAKDIKNINKKLSKTKASLEKEADKKFPMPKKPQKSNILTVYGKDGAKKRDEEIARSAVGEVVIDEIENNGGLSFEQLKESVSLMPFTEYTSRSIISLLVSEHAIKKSGNKYYIDYKGDPNWEVRLLSEEDILIHEAYMKEWKEEKEKQDAEREKEELERKNRILEIMKGKGPISIADIREYSPELDSIKTDMMIDKLVDEGVIVETKRKSRTYYEYK